MSVAADFVPNRALRRYILADERVIVATHRHWAKLWEPILTTSGAFILALALLVAVDPGVRDSLGWVWLPFLVLGARLLYKWLGWRAEWFVMTDRRLLLLDGFLVHRVAMMPSEKVTDLGYERTPLGQVLGYGTFIFETAGQDQALDRVTWVPRPDARYRLIIATLFHPDATDAEVAAQAGTDNRPVVIQPSEPAAAVTPPPALMPRIGRRSNPPTQRIELPVVRGEGSLTGDAPGMTSDAERPLPSGRPTGAAPGWTGNVLADGGAPAGSTAGGPAGAGTAGGSSAGAPGPRTPGTTADGGPGWSSTGAAGPAAGNPATGPAVGGAAGAASGGAAAGGGAPGGSTYGGVPGAGTSGAGTSGGSRSGGLAPTPGTARRPRPGDAGHVPGGPTASGDDEGLLPKPFLEGGDPKIR
ncbi:PH domain-containing protein [Promicromonospora thailandica]|uniref:PH domain-containing protein n=1 Tax=Promicromonospora thailandica TaxID=765201 RepID=A0A9X2JY43_9MICO|nr:PH domain-containing protein [Promicromonospora thailandica]MCP2267287.1 PH domain-containing protein [Promicromonospora thailandica]BFF20856.1 hypothetical protein GCM10025730_43770 [Promicromonospora thailandica]